MGERGKERELCPTRNKSLAAPLAHSCEVVHIYATTYFAERE